MHQAARVARRLPALKAMELFRVDKSSGGLLQYTTRDAETQTRPRVYWLGTWRLRMTRSVFNEWCKTAVVHNDVAPEFLGVVMQSGTDHVAAIYAAMKTLPLFETGAIPQNHLMNPPW